VRYTRQKTTPVWRGESGQKRKGRRKWELTGVCIAIHPRDLKLVVLDNPLETDVALEILGLLQPGAAIRGHADDHPGLLFAGRRRLVVLVVGRKGGVVEIEDYSDVMLMCRELLVLETLEVLYPCTIGGVRQAG
jgi:hypothetical protein